MDIVIMCLLFIMWISSGMVMFTKEIVDIGFAIARKINPGAFETQKYSNLTWIQWAKKVIF